MVSRRKPQLPATIDACHQLIIELDERIEELERQVAQLQRQLYGSRRERFEGDSLSIDAIDDSGEEDAQWIDEVAPWVPGNPVSQDALASSVSETPSSPSETPTAAPPPHESLPPHFAPDSASPEVPLPPKSVPPSRRGRQRRSWYEHAPRQRVYHPLREGDVPAALWNHPRARRFFRFVREEVELPKSRVCILEHYQEVMVMDDPVTMTSTFAVAPTPEPLLDRCYVGTNLLSYLAVSRFMDHLPYYREEEILRRSGMRIHRSTQWRPMRGLAQVALPLVSLIRQRLLTSGVLGMDETPCPILDPELGRTRKAYLYAQYGDDTQPYVGYHFAPYKTRQNIEPLLRGFRGTLQSDAYVCYELIAQASDDTIVPATCWAHARRKFEPLVVAGPHPQATWILCQIQRLYDVEDRARGMSNDDRRVLRQAESRPIVVEIKHWLEARDALEKPRAAIREGINYLLKRWDSFTRFLDNGAIGLDNNRTEAAIKLPVMGKKAWLFFGHEVAGETAGHPVHLDDVLPTSPRRSPDLSG
jgi:transposase